MAKFIGTLKVELIEDTQEGLWRLLEPLSFQSDVAERTITVPAGFKTDFCSVPRLPGIFDFLGDRARMSGTVHDYLYSTHLMYRELADMVLREMVLLDGLNETEATMFYAVVRAGGESHW